MQGRSDTLQPRSQATASGSNGSIESRALAPAGSSKDLLTDSWEGNSVRVLHWRELYDKNTGRLRACRPPGAPAGAFVSTPYWHCVWHDPYERICFWSHSVPAVLFLLLGCLALGGAMPGSLSLFVYTCCTGATHFSSALTHVYPDSHLLEKIDHVGIVATIVGTPVTALMAQEHGLPHSLLAIAALLVVAAFLRPVPRVAGFVLGGAAAVALHGRQLLSWVMAGELALYVAGASLFLRNGGHSRGGGFLADHHLLHYAVTLAGLLHVYYIMNATEAS